MKFWEKYNHCKFFDDIVVKQIRKNNLFKVSTGGMIIELLKFIFI